MEQLKVFSKSIDSMKSTLDVHIVMPNNKENKANKLIEEAYAEAQRLIQIISAWDENTTLYKVNKMAGIAPVKVCDELFQLIKRGVYLSEITNGLFDITFASIDKIWYFDKPLAEKPSAEKIQKSVRNINYKFIELNDENQSIFINNKGTKIELGAIGKGFIATKMKDLLQKAGIKSGLISAGGDMTSWGQSIRENGFWNIGVADPNKEVKNIAWLPIQNESIATSGNYERFAIIDGKRYSHIIHPKTGYPVEGIKSVTVLSPDAELCDAIATTIFLKGVKKGLDFVNQFFDIRCFIIDDNEKKHFSKNFKVEISYPNTANQKAVV
ncbi:FAD:protein FMN transferase [Tenacibaculum finnmarkense]|uniref:FAD:protein FMN transferase n=1 Tax=Tenacibaculum finnmarkense TaxID=2781243 RepID=UPI001E2B43F2|nr:FAD:protein FMN transferase [Tenacibaculum finnmarkense]MCD8444003.1 FAD:protein FMN transferase [Tenacibaculum finnmarkense genomovar ulcerans]MCG8235411.1 FAD:protein FMN transferase [Tenacibaculum finnmarkense genomovar ulcerans]MCG8732636.1 FAD:protein FMN transferase [Tenacibaculum finnmarkense]MCG8748597.1 FAD:protein FMN transferase [Tenacibaculum finnmarkense]MCG8753505.1 FAD:protein FMN transferase [Tenacibaculum finnmarkense]